MDETKTESIAFGAGREAFLRGEKLKNSALKNLRPGCKQYDDFIAGFDSTKKIPKVPNEVAHGCERSDSPAGMEG